MSIDMAFRCLEEANPVPNPDSLPEDVPDLAVLLATTEQGSTKMQTQQRSDAQTEKPSRARKWGVALAAAVAAVSVGILAIVIPGDETESASGIDPVDGPTSSESTVEEKPRFLGKEPAGTYRSALFQPGFVITTGRDGWQVADSGQHHMALVPPDSPSDGVTPPPVVVLFVAPDPSLASVTAGASQARSVDEAIDLLVDNEGLEVSTPQPTTLGDREAIVLEATGTESTIPLWSNDTTFWYGTTSGHAYRFYAFEVDGEPIVIMLDYRDAEQMNALSSEVSAILDSIRWDG